MMMNCDHTFDVLTRGPFPSGDGGVDAAVESHLAACFECRQLAEALRPAVGLFHEAMNEQESLSLPGYSGELGAADEGTVQTMTAATVTVPRSVSVTRTSRRSAAIAWAFAATCLLGFLVGMFGERARSGHTFAQATSNSHPADSGVPSQQGQMLLASLDLPSACHETLANGTAGSVYQCCTRCHAAADNATAPHVRLSTLTRLCAVCHVDA